MASISAVDIQEEGTYAQRYGWMEHGCHKAYPIALHHGVDWGYTEAVSYTHLTLPTILLV